MHPAPLKANRGHMTFAGVAPGSLQSFFEAITVDQLHPLLNPPGLLAQSVFTERGEVVADGHGQVSSKARRSRN
ncbi:MAG: Uncharacterised protein [Synechococcus sp. CC9902]|nr:MAG: Uncharacterised protein [Synechococcus sp. CC9902]